MFESLIFIIILRKNLLYFLLQKLLGDNTYFKGCYVYFLHRLIISLWRSLDFTKICTSVS